MITREERARWRENAERDEYAFIAGPPSGRVLRLLAALDAADAVWESLAHCRSCVECGDGPCCHECGSDAALDNYRALVAPSSTPDAAPPAERGNGGA